MFFVSVVSGDLFSCLIHISYCVLLDSERVMRRRVEGQQFFSVACGRVSYRCCHPGRFLFQCFYFQCYLGKGCRFPCFQTKCLSDNCLTCSALGNSGKCTDHNVVYEIKCGFQSCRSANIGLYNGETYRPDGERFMEHYRSARNPDAPSYLDKPLAKHYSRL